MRKTDTVCKQEPSTGAAQSSETVPKWLLPRGNSSLSFKLKRRGNSYKKAKLCKVSCSLLLLFPFCQQKLLKGSLAAHLCLFFALLNINPKPNRVEVRKYVRYYERILKVSIPTRGMTHLEHDQLNNSVGYWHLSCGWSRCGCASGFNVILS